MVETVTVSPGDRPALARSKGETATAALQWSGCQLVAGAEEGQGELDALEPDMVKLGQAMPTAKGAFCGAGRSPSSIWFCRMDRCGSA